MTARSAGLSAGPPATGSGFGAWVRRRAGPFAALASLILWEGVSHLPGAAFLLAGPSDIAVWLWSNAGLAARATGTTLRAAAMGFLAGNAVAIVLAALAITMPRAERAIGALMLLSFCLPMVATGPLLRVLYGPGIGPQVTIAALAVAFTTYLALMTGLRAAPSSWFDLIRSYGRGRASELAHVRIRAALPYLFAGLQIAAPAAILGALVGEFTGADRGLGVLTLRAMRSLDLPATWAVASLAAAAAIAAYVVLGAVGRWLSQVPVATILAPPPERRGQGGMPAPLRWSATLVVCLVLWQVLMDAGGLNPFFAKRPLDVWTHFTVVPGAAGHRATLLWAWGQTMVLTVPGYLAGLALGAGLAALVTRHPGAGTVLMPAAIALRSIPIVTTAPLIVFALGRGASGTITVVAAMIFFPTLVACLGGLRQTPAQVRDLFSSYAASPSRRLWHAQVPAMLPAFFAAARMAVPAALLAATTTEWLATGIGMGSLMAMTASTSDYGMLWGGVVLLSLTAAFGYVGAATVERAVLRRLGPEHLVP